MADGAAIPMPTQPCGVGDSSHQSALSKLPERCGVLLWNVNCSTVAEEHADEQI
jgi:hypothetical protein